MMRREHIRMAVLILCGVFLSGIAPAILAHSLTIAAEPSTGVDLSWIKDISVTGALCFLGFLTYKLVGQGLAVWSAKSKDGPAVASSDFSSIAGSLSRIEHILETQAGEFKQMNTQLAICNERLGTLIANART